MEFRVEVLALVLVNIILVFTIIELSSQHRAQENLSRLEIIQQRQRTLVGLTARLDEANALVYRQILASDLSPPQSRETLNEVDVVISLNEDQIGPERSVTVSLLSNFEVEHPMRQNECLV